MMRLRLTNWKWLVLGSLVAVFVVAAACGDDAPAAPSGLTASDVGSAVESAVKAAVGDTVSAEEIAGMVNSAVAGIDIPEGVSAADVSRLVNEAVAGIDIPEGVSASEIDKMVREATAAAVAGAESGVSAEDLAMAIEDAVSAAVADAVAMGPVVVVLTPTPVAMARAEAKPPAYVDRGKYGGIPTFAATSDPGVLDLHACASINSCLTVNGARYNQLVEFNPVNPTEIIGDLATGWEVSRDGRTYTFFIHPDANWTDGVPVTAADVVFSLDRIVDPNATRLRAGAALKPFYAPGNAKVVDDKTVDMTIKFATAAFLPWLAFDYLKMYPKHIAENLTQVEHNCCYEPMLGSGAFIWKSRSVGGDVEWERNPNYFKEGLPFFDGWKSIRIRDRIGAVASMKVGQLMGWTAKFQVSPTFDVYEVLEQETGGQLRAIQLQGVSQPGLMLNWKKPPFDDPNVRRAVMLVLDRVQLIKSVFKGFGQQGTFLPGGSTVADAEANWPGWRYVDADGNLITTDPVKVVGSQKHPDDIAEAIGLVQAAGQMGFEGTFLTFNDADAVNNADLVSRQLKEHFDWDITVRALDLSAASVERQAGNFNIHSDTHGMELNDTNALLGQMYLAGGGRNPLGWSDERIDVLAEQQGRAPTAAERTKFVLEIEEILKTGVAQWIPTMWLPAQGALNVKVRNFHLPRSTDVANSWNVLQKKEHLWMDPDAQPDWGLGP